MFSQPGDISECCLRCKTRRRPERNDKEDETPEHNTDNLHSDFWMLSVVAQQRHIQSHSPCRRKMHGLLLHGMLSQHRSSFLLSSSCSPGLEFATTAPAGPLCSLHSPCVLQRAEMLVQLSRRLLEAVNQPEQETDVVFIPFFDVSFGLLHVDFLLEFAVQKTRF